MSVEGLPGGDPDPGDAPQPAPWGLRDDGPGTLTDQDLIAAMPIPAPGAPPGAGVPPPPSPGRFRRAGRRTAAALLVVVLVVVSFSAGAQAQRSGYLPETPAQAPADARSEMPLLYQAWTIVEQNYVGRSSLDQKQLTYGAIRGLLDSLGDTGHTDFLTPQEAADIATQLTGAYVGIGVELSMHTDGAVIVRVFAGAPAAAAGLAEGDRIVSVDGTDVTGLSFDALRARLVGPAGTTVRVGIVRGNETSTREYTVTRAQVTIPNVTWAMVPGAHIADVQIQEFAQGTDDALRSALAAARAAGAASIVLDLRGNPGGYVDQAVSVASEFLKDGVVYIQRDAAGTDHPSNVKPNGAATTVPLAVLVNQDSASGSEIVAGALQDNGRAKVVGTTTYGTGTVLSTFTLADGSEVRIGVAEWLTPKGRHIWHQGIQPDVVVDLPAGATALDPDQLQTMTAASLAASKDAQLLGAVNLLGGNG